MEVVLRAKQIADKLWQGALAHVSQDGYPEGVEVVLLMAERVEALPNAANVPVLYLPIPDNPDGLTEEQFAQVYGLCRAVQGACVLTICHMGENRSGLASALLLCLRGMEPAAAVKLVQTNGPHNSSNAPHSFWNPGFNKQVLEFFS